MARLADTENRAERRYSAELVDSLGNVSTVMTLRLQDAMRVALTRRLHEVFAPIRRSILVNEAKWCTLDLVGNLFRIGLVSLYVWLLWRQGDRRHGRHRRHGLPVFPADRRRGRHAGQPLAGRRPQPIPT